MVCPYSLTVPGGVQLQVLGLARTLRAKGVDVRVIAPCDGPPPDVGITPIGASLPTAANGSIAPIAPDLAAQLRLIRTIISEDFDVLHLHEPLAPGVGITTVLMQAAPTVGTFHAAGRSSAYRWVNRGCRALRRRLTVACAVSADAEQLASTWLGGTYERVFNGIEVQEFAGAAPTPTTGPTIFFVGRHEVRKGLGVLLDSLRYLGPEVTVWVASDGEQTADLKRRHAQDPRIEWLGRITEAEKRSRLVGADAACFPSLGGESFGVVLLEAMAAGTATVASDIDGYRKVARSGLDSDLVPPDDPKRLAAALRTALEGGPAVQERIAAGRDRADAFSMSALADRYITLYHQAISAHKR